MTTEEAHRITFHENARYAQAQLKEAEREGNTFQRRQAAQLARFWQAKVASLTPRPDVRSRP